MVMIAECRKAIKSDLFGDVLKKAIAIQSDYDTSTATKPSLKR